MLHDLGEVFLQQIGELADFLAEFAGQLRLREQLIEFIG